MEHLDVKRILRIAGITLAASAVLLGSVYGGLFLEKLAQEKRALEAQVASLARIGEIAIWSLTAEKGLTRNLTDANLNLGDALRAEQDKNLQFTSQIAQISGTVGKLEKLSKTPPELLKKYSRVYFLNEHYVPAPLMNIDAQYLLEKDRAQQILVPVWPYLNRMLAAVNADGKGLLVVSAYRSFGEQSGLKASYKIQYGSGANRFSADQGYSEHQLGTTIDLTSRELGGLSVQFDASPAYEWLRENAYRYGFILSYPKGNAYYQYEPWHWRFVGVALAQKIHDQNTYFYDVPQNEIDPFLISIFD